MTVADLPRYRGMPVPHVALWSAERPTLDLLIGLGPAVVVNPLTGMPQLRFLDAPQVDARCRDANGVLWSPENDAQGQGEALLSQLNAKRQRRAVLDGRCQVCDVAMDPVTFLLPRNMAGPATINTAVAPLCKDCGPAALRYCPHLRTEGPWSWATVTSLTQGGYVGDLTTLLPDGSVGQEKMVTLAMGDSRLPLLLAKQAVGKLAGITWEDA